MKRIVLALLAVAAFAGCENPGGATGPSGTTAKALKPAAAGDCGGGPNGCAGGCGGSTAGDGSETVYRVPLGSSPVAGAADALVTLVEFTDFQCPFCSRANGTVDELVKAYGPKLRVAVKQMPLPFHANAKGAALAALAANEQGKYWQTHQRLFSNQQALDAASLEKHAQELGLNVGAWKNAMQSTQLQEQLNADTALATALGARGTPTFFVNGRILRGAQPIESFRKLIDQELAKAETLVKQGVRPEQVYERIIEKGVTSAPAPAPAANAGPRPAAEIAGEVKPVTVPADAPQRGSRMAKITVVAFSDFQCPFCSRGEAVLKQLQDTYGDKVRVVFRNMPLPFHDNARLAAAAALAAHEQGKFWEYHDVLFNNQQALDRTSLEKYAQQLGLDMARFKSALDANTFEKVIAADVAEAQQLGVSGTPTFFVNGRAIIGARPFEDFKTVVDDELKKGN